jgi:hypothetical protein
VLESLSIFPISFWAVIALLIGGAVWACRRISNGIGLPVLAVLGTVAAWYVGDALYNDYAGYHAKIFEPGILQLAWWEVAWFLAAFLLVTPVIHQRVNAPHLGQSSGVFQMFKYGVEQPVFQSQLAQLFWGCASVWLVLVLIATIRVRGDILYFFFPFLGGNGEPWGRGRIGSGFDALLTVAFYFQMLVTSIFGVVAALATNRRIRFLALVCCLLSMPYFIFQRARNILLAAVIPGMLSWVFLRLRGGILKKLVVIGGFFLLVNAWMGFIIANRSMNSISGALRENGFSLTDNSKVHHEGLNMFEELCWINTFMNRGTYSPNWGSRYFAEMVNVIPRTLWPGKPMIGIDYAIARGGGDGTSGQAGVYTTVSTGMIGQGVVNFGRWLGPLAAALLMSFWVAILARLDLEIHELGRLPLYFCGVILTFNLGRDITLITLYPFVFGYIAVRLMDRWHHAAVPVTTQVGIEQRALPEACGFPSGSLFGGRRISPQAALVRAVAPRKGKFPYAVATRRDHL